MTAVRSVLIIPLLIVLILLRLANTWVRSVATVVAALSAIVTVVTDVVAVLGRLIIAVDGIDLDPVASAVPAAAVAAELIGSG